MLEDISLEKNLRYNLIMFAKQIQQEKYFTRLDIFKQEIGTSSGQEEAAKIVKNFPPYPSIEETIDMAQKMFEFVENGK